VKGDRASSGGRRAGRTVAGMAVTLSEFLLARIAEDEATARQIGEGTRWRDDRGDVLAEHGALYWRRIAAVDEANGVSTIAAEHIARHDPARVLAECEAKRAVVQLLTESLGLLREANGEAEQMAARQGISVARLAVQALATVYAAHPDYDEAWRP
jgi:hypothetical protein